MVKFLRGRLFVKIYYIIIISLMFFCNCITISPANKYYLNRYEYYVNKADLNMGSCKVRKFYLLKALKILHSIKYNEFTIDKQLFLCKELEMLKICKENIIEEDYFIEGDTVDEKNIEFYMEYK
jgi:hypothetical protein